jgi:hypothetical protein
LPNLVTLSTLSLPCYTMSTKRVQCYQICQRSVSHTKFCTWVGSLICVDLYPDVKFHTWLINVNRVAPFSTMKLQTQYETTYPVWSYVHTKKENHIPNIKLSF